LVELLTHFKLPAAATQAELRKAYYKQAKMLHPDIAGTDSAEDFKNLKTNYEEALKWMREMEKHPHMFGPRAGGRGTAGGGPSPYGDWKDPSGQWNPNAFDGNFYGKEGYSARGVNFDPRAFRSEHRSHTKRDGSQHGYTYEASYQTTGGSAQAPSRKAAFTPAQWFRYGVVASGGVIVAARIVRRMQAHAEATRGRVYT